MPEFDFDVTQYASQYVTAKGDELQRILGDRIATGADINPNTPGGAAAKVVYDAVIGGDFRDRASMVAVGKSVGGALGAACGPGALVCSWVFSELGGIIVGGLHDWISGARRKERRAKRRAEDAWQAVQEDIADAINQIRYEYTSYLGEYLSQQKAEEHFYAALYTVPGYQNCFLDTIYRRDTAVQEKNFCIDRIVPAALATVIATYRNVQIERISEQVDDWVLRLVEVGYSREEANEIAARAIEEDNESIVWSALAAPSRSESAKRAGEGAAAMARAEGKWKSNVSELVDAGYNEDFAKRVASEGDEAVEKALREKWWENNWWWVVAVGLAAAGGGGYYYFTHTETGRTQGRQLSSFAGEQWDRARSLVT